MNVHAAIVFISILVSVALINGLALSLYRKMANEIRKLEKRVTELERKN